MNKNNRFWDNELFKQNMLVPNNSMRDCFQLFELQSLYHDEQEKQLKLKRLIHKHELDIYNNIMNELYHVYDNIKVYGGRQKGAKSPVICITSPNDKHLLIEISYNIDKSVYDFYIRLRHGHIIVNEYNVNFNGGLPSIHLAMNLINDIIIKDEVNQRMVDAYNKPINW